MAEFTDTIGPGQLLRTDSSGRWLNEPVGATQRNLPSDSAARKQVPMATGLLDYFPDALAEVAHISYLGNEKHNPGEPLHWARGKSMDHADCAVRHLTERGGRDPAGIRHTGQAAWRVLALLQQELEEELNLPLPRGAQATPQAQPHRDADGACTQCGFEI